MVGICFAIVVLVSLVANGARDRYGSMNVFVNFFHQTGRSPRQIFCGPPFEVTRRGGLRVAMIAGYIFFSLFRLC